MVGIIVIGLWVIYRVARGWLKLKDGQPIRPPERGTSMQVAQTRSC